MNCKGCYYNNGLCKAMNSPTPWCYATKEEGERREADIRKYVTGGRANSVSKNEISKMIKANLEKLYNQGLDDYQIAERLGVTKACIGKNRRLLGLPMQKERAALLAQERLSK